MLMRAETSCLLVVDFQERLMPAVHQTDQVVANGVWLIQIAQRLGVPVLASEQYPVAWGTRSMAIRELLPAEAFMEKTAFFLRRRIGMHAADRRCSAAIKWFVVGAEAHVCVLQTVAGPAGGRQGSLSGRGWRYLRARRAMWNWRWNGCAPKASASVSREMVAFEWLHQAGTDRFREISRDFLR
ncbi:MAG: isochorismatase family protein [Chromatiales bacterium]|nr:isochorismatase family protein [Chromatiales bacterium]